MAQATTQTYFRTYSEAVQQAKASIQARGIELNEEDWYSQVTLGPGKPSEGKTVSHTIGIISWPPTLRIGKKACLQIQVYNTGTSYELNYYIF
jgi:hypothetical protein